MEAAKCTTALSNLLENVSVTRAATTVSLCGSVCCSVLCCLHIAQPTCVEVLCDVLRKEVEEALTSNVGLCGVPSVCVRGECTRVHVLHPSTFRASTSRRDPTSAMRSHPAQCLSRARRTRWASSAMLLTWPLVGSLS